MYVNIETGADARVAGVDPISGNDLGVRFSGFRTLERFDAQINGLNVGHVSWPGGALAEAYPDRFGLNYDGLFNPALGQPGLAEMMSYCVENNMSLSVVLPTARYANDLDQLRLDIRDFMSDLLSGQYGEVPDNMFLHIGSEHYAHFQGLTDDGAAAGYGRVAAVMVEEITNALDDPEINQINAEIDVAVQAGRTLPEDEMIRDAFTDEQLAEVDMVTHHRYASQADGIDGMLRGFRPINEAWQADVLRAGGEEPQINLGEWNVASVTRNEALTRYIRDMGAQGITIDRDDVDLEGRTNVQFENYWQTLLETRDYGAAAPQLYLEMFSEYAAEGLGAASIHAADLMHAGRITYTDVDGNPVQFVGADMIGMIYESVEDTTVMRISEANRPNSPMATYGFENDDRLVLFVAADENTTLGEVTLNIEGLEGGYTAIWTDSLHAEVPDDWMERFGITDNPNVDESNEGQTYALGVRDDIAVTIDGDEVTFDMTEPGQVVRIIIARTPEEAAAIEEWAGPADYLAEDIEDEDDPSVPGPVGSTPDDADPDHDDDDEDDDHDNDNNQGQNTWAHGWSMFGSSGTGGSAGAGSGGAAQPVTDPVGGWGTGGVGGHPAAPDTATDGAHVHSLFSFFGSIGGRAPLVTPSTPAVNVVPTPATPHPATPDMPSAYDPSSFHPTASSWMSGLFGRSAPVRTGSAIRANAMADDTDDRDNDDRDLRDRALDDRDLNDDDDDRDDDDLDGLMRDPEEELAAQESAILDDDEDEDADDSDGSESLVDDLISMVSAFTGLAMGSMLLGMSGNVF